MSDFAASPTPSTRTQRTALLWTLLAAHVIAFVVAFDDEPVFAAVTACSTVLVLSTWYTYSGGRAISLFLAHLFVAVNVFVFAYMNILYLECTNQPAGVYHDLTAWMAALMCAAVMSGAALAHVALGREPISSSPAPLVMRPELMTVATLLFGVIAIGQISTGWLNARWERTGDRYGTMYLIEGVGPIWLMFFLVLGTRVRGALLAPRNLILLGIVVVLALLQGMSGSRGWSVYMILMVLAGLFWSGFGVRRLVFLAMLLIVAGTFFSAVVQAARGKQGFAYGSADQRATLLLDTARDVRQEEDVSGDSVWEPLIARLYEFSAQVVIDQTVLTQQFAGFESFERLQYLFVPQVLAPEKLPLSDGKEILIRQFGYVIGPNTGVPITLVADAYRRGGALWVACVGFALGMALRLLPRLTVLLVGAELALIPLVLFATMVISLPSESVLGTITVLSYHWLKQVLVFLAVSMVFRLLIVLSLTRAERGLGFAPPQ